MTVVVERDVDEWIVRHNGILRATRETKADAVESAQYLARKWSDRLEVRRSNGAPHYSRSYGYAGAD